MAILAADARRRTPRRVEISTDNAVRFGLRTPVHSSTDGVFFGSVPKHELNGAQREYSTRKSIRQCRRGMTCKSALCAHCSARRVRLQRHQLLQALDASRPGYALLWTFTIASTPDRALGVMLRDLTRLHTAVNRSGWLSGQVDGYARSIEIEHSAAGWHPHGHELIVFREVRSRAEAQAFAVRLRDRYLAEADRLGIPAAAVGQHVRVVPLDQLPIAARYITKSHVMTKPKQDGTMTLAMLTQRAYGHGDAEALDLLREAENAMFRKQTWRPAGLCKPL